MTWVKLDDGFISHPKTLQLDHKSIVLHLAGLCYCSAQLTDGTITAAAIPGLLGVARCGRRQLTELVKHGVWLDQGKVYLIHDYLEYQESREKVLARREAAAERKRKSRAESQRDSLRDSQRPSHDTRPDPTRPRKTPLISLVTQTGDSEPVDNANDEGGTAEHARTVIDQLAKQFTDRSTT